MNPHDMLSAFGLGPRKCEDCGEIFTVPPYMDCANWRHCEPCSSKRFQAWIKTPDAKKALEMFKARNFQEDTHESINRHHLSKLNATMR